jgi:hypothetical protein
VEVNINFGEPGVDGAHRFPRIVAHQLPLARDQTGRKPKVLPAPGARLEDDSKIHFCDSRPGDRPDPLQPLQSAGPRLARLSAERLNLVRECLKPPQ